MSSSFYDVFSMNAVFKYNQSTDEWILPEYRSRFGRRDFFLWNRLLHDATLLAIEALPDRWRKDEVVEALISLIVIFDPDQVGLNFPDSVRLACLSLWMQLCRAFLFFVTCLYTQSYFKSHRCFTSQSMKAKDLQDNNSIISLSQAEVSNINKKLLQVLSSSEDTIKTCLSSDQHEVTVNDNTDCDQSTILSNTMHLNIDRFYLKTCRRFGSELDYINSYDAISDSIYSDDLNKLVFNIVYQNNLSLASSIAVVLQSCILMTMKT
uniref:Uncharacterized protein n=1 Tax=Tetranychus urticae TaxID=32264 RepID=T1JYK5_TETUR